MVKKITHTETEIKFIFNAQKLLLFYLYNAALSKVIL